MKTKIYQTIKGLIILFIKLQFSNQVQEAFRPLHTLIVNLSLNSNGLVTYIISNTFISSQYIRVILIHLMILDIYQQRSLYI